MRKSIAMLCALIMALGLLAGSDVDHVIDDCVKALENR